MIRDFNPPETLSPDLEWMITSPQVSHEQLIQVLLEEKGWQMFLSAWVMAADREKAWQLVFSTLVRIVEQRLTFEGEASFELWIYQQLMEAWKLSRSERVTNKDSWRFFQEFPETPEPLNAIYQATLDLSLTDRLRLIWGGLYRFTAGEQQCLLSIVNLFPPGADLAGSRASFPPRILQWLETWIWVRFPADLAGEWAHALIQNLNHAQLLRRSRGRVLEVVGFILAILIVFVASGLDPLGELEVVGFSADRITVVVTQLVYVTSTPSTVEEERASPLNATVLYAMQGETLRELAQRAWVDVEKLVELNDLSSEATLDPFQPIVLGFDGPTLVEKGMFIVPKQVLRANLDLASRPGDVYQAMRNNIQHWSTLYLEGLALTYPPPGYHAYPKIERGQIWAGAPDLVLALEGEWGKPVRYTWRSESGFTYFMDHKLGIRRKTPDESPLGHSKIGRHLLGAPNLSSFESKTFRIFGEDQVAGRTTIKVEWIETDYSPNSIKPRRVLQRAWVDSATGILLRRQEFWGDTPDHLAMDVIAFEVALDRRLSSQLFDHTQPMPSNYKDPMFPTDWTDRIASTESQMKRFVAQIDYEEISLTPAPDSFHASGSALEFWWHHPQVDEAELSLYQSAYILAEGYLIGTVPLGNPYTLRCRRSPDGSKIAFSTGIVQTWQAGLPLQWFDLGDLKIQAALKDEIYPYDWAFSSDGQFLAVYGCDFRNDCQIFVVDLMNEAEYSLGRYDHVENLVWGANDQTLIFVGMRQRGDLWQAWMVDGYTAEVLYRGALFPLSSLLAHEGVDFPQFPDWRGWLQYQPCALAAPRNP